MEHTTSSITKNNRQKDIISYNLDHVYCSEESSYRNNNSNNNNGSDVKALRKENKQLQAMLLLHLDLIQEQSNQLIAKDKQLIQLREEIEELRLKCERLERSPKPTKIINRDGLSAATITSSLDDNVPILLEDNNKTKPNNLKCTTKAVTEEKLQLDVVSSKKTTIDIQPDCDKFVKINNNLVLAKANQQNVVPITNNNISSSCGSKGVVDSSNIIGQNNGRIISKIILQRKQSVSGEKLVVKTECTGIEAEQNSFINETTTTSKASTATTTTTTTTAATSTITNTSILTPLTVAVNRTSGLLLKQQHVNRSNTSENIPLISQDTNQNLEQKQTTVAAAPTTPIPNVKTEIETEDSKKPTLAIRSKRFIEHHPKQNEVPSKIGKFSKDSSFSTISTASSALSTAASSSSASNLYNGSILSTRRHWPRNSIITTKKLYKTREWQMEEIEAEINRQIAAELCEEPVVDSEQTNLEIPKWRTWEYSSLGGNKNDISTAQAAKDEKPEDLNEEAFVKRHARFLLDERKRKKWDVQRIREQRTIERLKRRHCKDELTEQKDSDEITSFFPSADNLKAIQLTDDIPVCAFGECIPALPAGEFTLPWLTVGSITPAATTSSSKQSHHQPHESFSQSAFNTNENPVRTTSIVFISKKRAGRTKVNHITPTVTATAATATISNAPPAIPVTPNAASPLRQRRTRHRQ